MEIKDIAAKIDGISQTVVDSVKAAKEEINGNVDVKVKETETRLQDEISNAKGVAQKSFDKVEDLEKKFNTSGMGGNGGGVPLVKQLEEKFKAVKGAKRGEFSLDGYAFSRDMGQKAVGNMASATNLTGTYFVAPTVVPGVIGAAYNQTHIRNLISTGTTDSNVVRHIRDNGGEGGPTTVAEGATKPQMDRDLAIVDANVRKIATYLRVPEEMISDIPFLTSFLTEVGTEEVLAVEDAQLLYGDGTGQNISGLATNATAFAAGTSVVASPNNFDVLRAGAKQMRVAKRNPDVFLVSPTDYYDMVSKKDTTNNYILSGGGNGLMPVIDGMPIVQLNQVAAGDFFVLDRRASQIFFRENVNVRFYEQDQDNAIKNLVTIVIEERLALAIYFTAGIIKGTFATAITDLTS